MTKLALLLPQDCRERVACERKGVAGSQACTVPKSSSAQNVCISITFELAGMTNGGHFQVEIEMFLFSIINRVSKTGSCFFPGR